MRAISRAAELWEETETVRCRRGYLVDQFGPAAPLPRNGWRCYELRTNNQKWTRDVYAVIDLETTGLRWSWHDRVVEVAVVQLDSSGAPEQEWVTLVNPDRDLGRQDIHGIRAADVLTAPRFPQVAGKLVQLLAGRTVVAHNLWFDGSFLAAEYARLGIKVPVGPETGLCTMRLAARLLPESRRSLSECCATADVRHTNAHSALGDARATAALFGRYLRLAQHPPPWEGICAVAKDTQWPKLLDAGSAAVIRKERSTAPQEHFLSQLVHRLPRENDPEADTYLDMLDRALIDRHISATEAAALVDCARQLGISQEQATAIHRRYLTAVAAIALEDGVLSETELQDLRQVTELLGLTKRDLTRARRTAAEAGNRSDRLGRFSLNHGDVVVFTGHLDEPRQVWEGRATAAGMVAAANVTKRTRLVVAADPDSPSGKARKARRYGIPLVDPETFIRLASSAG